MKVRLGVPLLAASLLLLAACGSAATAIPSPAATPPPASAAHRLFIIKGCAACHGPNAEGTNIAPALTGHAASQVKRQVRAPVGLMPVFPPDRVSNDELNEIANYVSTLAGEHTHPPSVDPGMELVQHHWMALFALEAGESQEAIHHINHIIARVAGDHLARMQEALGAVREGQPHASAHHIVENMLAGIAPPGLTKQGMHLQLAISATRVEDTINAIHHVEHYLELAEADSKEARIANGIPDLLKAGELAEAEHRMSALAVGELQHGEGAGAGDHHEDEHDRPGP